MKTIMAWDELNLLREEAERFVNRSQKKQPTRAEIDRFCDYMEFVLCLIYAYGWKDAEEIVGINLRMGDLDDKAVNREVAGETFRDRVQNLFEDSVLAQPTVPDLLRIVETEAHRDYNSGVYDAGKKSGIDLKKQWVTMGDDRVRDTHEYLEGAVVGLDDRFYTFDGDSALHPGDFEKASNNVNCRCVITLAR